MAIAVRPSRSGAEVAAAADWRVQASRQCLPLRDAAGARRPPPDLPKLDGPQRDGLADLLVDVLAWLDRLFDAPPPWLPWIHQRPTDGGLWPEAHLHVHIVSPMRSPDVQRYGPPASWEAVCSSIRSCRKTPPPHCEGA